MEYKNAQFIVHQCTVCCASIWSVMFFDDYRGGTNPHLQMGNEQEGLAGGKSSLSQITMGRDVGHRHIRVGFIVGSITFPFDKSIILWICRIEIE